MTSSSACERNWSHYDYIHSRKRNRLTASKARDLVYVFTNGRLTKRLKSVGNIEPSASFFDVDSDS